MSWSEYLKMVGSKWTPGANFPFDPISAQMANATNRSNNHERQKFKKSGKGFPGPEIQGNFHPISPYIRVK